MNLKNIKAGFWRRFVAKGIDLTITGILVTLISLIFIDMNELKFRSDWMFYMWASLFGIILLVNGVIIPILTNGSSLGNWITKVRVVSNDKLSQAIVKREFFFTFAWLFLLLLITIIINHTLIIEYLKTERRVLTEWEMFRITIITTFGGLIAFIQLGLGISLLASSNQESFHDKTSNSYVIITNQFKKEKPKRKYIEPVSIDDKKQYEWVE